MGPEDEARLQSLFEADPDYFKIAEGAPPGPAAANGLLSDLPQGKEYRDKFDYAVTDRDGALVAVIDLLRGYPEDKIWFLGLLFIAPANRNKGLGTRALEAIFAHVQKQGGSALRLGVVRGNVKARALYDRMGFQFIRESERACANGFTVVIDVLERGLQ
jgi:RimJ/RimL family protein N-acetyltransferase